MSINRSVVAAADLYLDIHRHDEEAQLRVLAVLDKFEFMVNLAIDRALVELNMENVIPMQRETAPLLEL